MVKAGAITPVYLTPDCPRIPRGQFERLAKSGDSRSRLKVAGKPCQHSLSSPVTITNTTGNAEKVHAQFIALAKVPGGCSASAPPSWVHVSPCSRCSSSR